MNPLIAVLAMAGAVFAASPLPFLFAFGHELSLPAGLAVCADSGIAITDPGRHSVVKYSYAGELVTEAGSGRSGSAGLDSPQGITRRRGFDLFVCDERNNRLIQYDHNLCAISWLQLSPAKSRVPFCPAAIAAGNDGTLLVCDRLNSAIVRVEKDNSITPFLQTYRDLSGATLVPGAITVAGNAVCVADAATGAIYVFDRFGTLVRSFTTHLTIPMGGLAACGDTAIAAADTKNRALVVFSIEGGRLGSLGLGNAPGECVPGAICRSFDRWYIIDTHGKQVCVFSAP